MKETVSGFELLALVSDVNIICIVLGKYRGADRERAEMAILRACFALRRRIRAANQRRKEPKPPKPEEYLRTAMALKAYGGAPFLGAVLRSAVVGQPIQTAEFRLVYPGSLLEDGKPSAPRLKRLKQQPSHQSKAQGGRGGGGGGGSGGGETAIVPKGKRGSIRRVSVGAVGNPTGMDVLGMAVVTPEDEQWNAAREIESAIHSEVTAESSATLKVRKGKALSAPGESTHGTYVLHRCSSIL